MRKLILFLLILTAPALLAEDTPAVKSLKNGAAFLIKDQNEDGSWGKYKTPAIAALAVVALHECPADDETARDEAVEKAMTYVLKWVQDDGSVQNAGRKFIFFKNWNYPTYNTALSLLAMAKVNKPEYKPIMMAARDFLKSMQIDDVSSINHGGFGYAAGKDPNMSTTSWAAEALKKTDYLDSDGNTKSEEAIKSTKRMWEDLDKFLAKSQMLRNVPHENGLRTDQIYDGGFGYEPAEVAPAIVSTSAMTYAGLKSMVYADLDKSDARVKGAMHFVSNNYTFKESPGAGMKGYYYYLQTMTKALNAYGLDTIALADGSKKKWRDDAISQIAKQQYPDGSWVNTKNGRYLESLPALVTAYSMISLREAAKK
jgi:squalene-hopene/tetraprenyl-beta-curcumene cyclase